MILLFGPNSTYVPNCLIYAYASTSLSSLTAESSKWFQSSYIFFAWKLVNGMRFSVKFGRWQREYDVTICCILQKVKTSNSLFCKKELLNKGLTNELFLLEIHSSESFCWCYYVSVRDWRCKRENSELSLRICQWRQRSWTECDFCFRLLVVATKELSLDRELLLDWHH